MKENDDDDDDEGEHERKLKYKDIQEGETTNTEQMWACEEEKESWKKLEMCRGKCRRGRWRGGGGEDSIISARLVQFVTPAVVFNQPPRAACAANSPIVSLLLPLGPRGQLQQMGALSRDPQTHQPGGARRLHTNKHASTVSTMHIRLHTMTFSHAGTWWHKATCSSGPHP